MQESVRRIRTIALVHESLSREPGEDIAFIEIVRPLLRLAEEGLQSPDRPVRFTVSGDGGRIPANTATPLSVVLTELLQNAVDHGFPEGSGGGDVRGQPRPARRSSSRSQVIDNGRGVDPSFDLDQATGLGLSIVRTLVTTELERDDLDPPGDVGRSRRSAASATAPPASTAPSSNSASRRRLTGRASSARCGALVGPTPGSSLALPSPACNGSPASTSAATGGAGGGDAAAADDPTLFLGQPAPDAGVLVGLEREVEAFARHGALGAHFLGTIDLEQRVPCGAHRKEEVRVGVAADGVVAPFVVRGSQGEAGRKDRHVGAPRRWQGRLGRRGDECIARERRAARAGGTVSAILDTRKENLTRGSIVIHSSFTFGSSRPMSARARRIGPP